jgi:predicted component of type VI protein secretion system
MKLSLVVLTPGKMQGQVVEVKLAQFLVGRDPQCHLRPASPLISKRHCVLLSRDGKVFVRDFKSTNGTFVNNQPVTTEAELHHDDQLMIGPLQFRVCLEVAPGIDRLTPAPPTRGSPTRAVFRPAAPPAHAPPLPGLPPGPRTGKDRDDDIAALLLSLPDDHNGGPGPPADDTDTTTACDPTGMPEALPPDAGPPANRDREKNDATGRPQANAATTSRAAEDILARYKKRPRT